MPASLLIRLRPEGPWRIGPSNGARDRVDTVFHSDSLYSAVCAAMRELGNLEEWLDATARAGENCAVRFSSLFPYQSEHLFAPAPKHLWPPTSVTRLRAHGAKFVPLSVIAALAEGKPVEEDKWEVDGISECLVRSGRSGFGPFRVALSTNAAVDRVEPGVTATHQTASLEFGHNSGMWGCVQFASDQAQQAWQKKIEAAFRLLADSGLGGERSRWGQATVEIRETDPLPKVEMEEGTESAYWLLSLFNPAQSETIDWERGSYSLVERSGRVESNQGWGTRKKSSQMVSEGSVVFAKEAPTGQALDVAPEGFPHPVYRNGYAVSVALPWRLSV